MALECIDKGADSGSINERSIVVSLILQVYSGSYREEFFANSEYGKLYRKIFLNTMRHLPFIDALIDKHSKTEPTLSLRSIIAMGITQVLFMDSIPDYAAVSSTVELAPRHQKSYVNWVLMEVVRNKDAILAEHTIYDDFPNDFINSLKIHCTGDELKQLLTTLNTPPVYWGLDTATGEIVDVQTLPYFQDIRVDSELQEHGILPMDKASAMIALKTVSLANTIAHNSHIAQSNHDHDHDHDHNHNHNHDAPLHILDACAAPGGKTVAMAKLLPHSQIHAVEINPSRFRTLESYLKEYGVNNVSPMNMDIMSLTTDMLHLMPPVDSNSEKYQQATTTDPSQPKMWDITLLDAPCSCLGTIRRHPEVRAIKNTCDIATLQPIQLSMLHHVATITKHYIHYCVCSLEAGETVDVIDEFLKTNPNFKLERQQYIMPHIENSDGFYSAILKRETPK